MPRGPQILSPQQRQLLEEARAAHVAYAAAEREAQAEYEVLMNRRLTPYKARLARAVRDAVTSGVPKSRINSEALGVTTPNAWIRWADMAQAFDTGASPAPAYVAPAPTPPLPPQFAEAHIASPERLDVEPEWPLPARLAAHEHAARLSFIGNPADRRLRVNWPGYESPAPDAPAVLEGVVVYNPERPSGWDVEHDPQDKQTEFGVEPGVLTFEVTTRRGGSPLRTALAEFIAAAELPLFEAVPRSHGEGDDDGF